MRKYFFRRIGMVCAIICAILLMLRLSYTILYNRSLTKDFVPDDWITEYQDHSSMDEMDIEKIVDSYFSVSPLNAPLDQSVVLDRDIYYYSEPDGDSQILCKLNAGERYFIYGDFLTLQPRTLSLPTYDQGWRYALPLITEEQYRKLDYLSGLPVWVRGEGPYISEQYGYIRTEDMIYLIRNFQRQSAGYSWMDEIRWLFDDRYALGHLYGADQLLWEEGVYLSPDLPISFWRLPEILLLLLIVSGIAKAAVCAAVKRR